MMRLLFLTVVVLYNHRPKDTSVSSTYYSTQAMGDELYKDEDWLREQYVEKDKSMNDIAGIAECGYTTVNTWINKFDIEKEPKLYKDEEWLEEKYVEERKSAPEMGEIAGCSGQTVIYWMDKYDIDRRDCSEYVSLMNSHHPASHHFLHDETKERTTEQWSTLVGEEQKILKVHRLLAVSKYGFDTVCDNVVHHKNGLPWDNRPSNIEVMSPSEHQSVHVQKLDRAENGQLVPNKNE